MVRHQSRAKMHCAVVLASFCLALHVAAGVAAEEKDADSIPWRSDYASALEEASSSKQLLWIQFTGHWCPNCTRMEQDSFPHPAIRDAARRSFVPVKLRADVYEELALGFGLSALPATVIVAPTRQVLAVRQGYLGPVELGELLRDWADRQEATSHLASGEKSKGSDASGIAGPQRSLASVESSKKAKAETELALSGYCVVSLVSDKRLVPGQAGYTITHEGRLYRFANSITFNLFRRDPERYIPVNAGNCPVTQIDRGTAQPGDPRYGVLFQNRLFLCASDAERKKFLEQPARYAAVDAAEQGYCPHCLAQNGLLVRGDPRYVFSRQGRRYWFPDATHREAFLAALTDLPTRR
jgi:YHS domain-containing protein